MRRRRAEKRKTLPDPKYHSDNISKFVNLIMIKGKKTTAQRIVYDAFDIIEKKTGKDPVSVFYQALDSARPKVAVRSRRVGGATYQVPMEVRSERRKSLAMKWIIDFARMRKEKTMSDRLANELLDAYNKRGSSIKKKEDLHKMAEANKAFAHYRY